MTAEVAVNLCIGASAPPSLSHFSWERSKQSSDLMQTLCGYLHAFMIHLKDILNLTFSGCNQCHCASDQLKVP